MPNLKAMKFKTKLGTYFFIDDEKGKYDEYCLLMVNNPVESKTIVEAYGMVNVSESANIKYAGVLKIYKLKHIKGNNKPIKFKSIDDEDGMVKVIFEPNKCNMLLLHIHDIGCVEDFLDSELHYEDGIEATDEESNMVLSIFNRVTEDEY